ARDLVLEVHAREVGGGLLQRELGTLEILVLVHGELGGVRERAAQEGGKCEPSVHDRSSEKGGNRGGMHGTRGNIDSSVGRGRDHLSVRSDRRGISPTRSRRACTSPVGPHRQVI